MKFYIDPGTGSMLFAIFIGILGALNYLVRMAIVKIRFVLSGGKKVALDDKKIPFVIFSDNKRYWTVFEPICREFNKRGIDVVYMTASPDDPVLNCEYEHIKGEFIGKNNMAFAKLNFLKATIVFSTTPGLDVYQWKRSKDVDYYVHIPHAAGEISLYRMFGIDYYDGILLSGEFQVQDVRKLENLRDLPAKDIYKVGIPYMDEMVKRLENSPATQEHERTVLLAPSWGPGAIFGRFGGSIIEKLIGTGYHIIIRPHPQSFDSEKELMDELMKKYPDSEQIEWNRDMDNFEVLKRSDILISDFSGVTYEFAFVYDKPIMYTEVNFDKGVYDAWWLEDELWTTTALPRIGMELTEDKMDSLKEMIDECIENPKYEKGRIEARNETWEHYGQGAVRATDWLINKYNELTQGKGE